MLFIVTDWNRKFVLAVATSQDLEVCDNSRQLVLEEHEANLNTISHRPLLNDEDESRSPSLDPFTPHSSVKAHRYRKLVDEPSIEASTPPNPHVYYRL